ncbi:hypothetical protein IGB42_00356 [Andreprevotia sp. IGB-42]|uniref:hypothetical protein n=1 Tax=Andreprevotia sp. IGB-42 TaxID=2497473 RepID=UPI0013589B3C|nr:hypothetical protein [Andreprevotia sp. IGB-42]KAF0815275.1 hypothetical protein IGB42_00356 [Andreprevotia sp. IGB-42]
MRALAAVRISLLAMAFTLTACGGGGGSNGASGGATSNGNALIFSPPTLDVDIPFAGPENSKEVTVSATASGAIDGDVYVKVTEPTGTFKPNISVRVNNRNITATLVTIANLPTGTRSGKIKVQLCRDYDCKNEYPGSPSYLPFNVSSAWRQPQLSSWAGVADWGTERYNQARNPFVPVTLDPQQFSPRWEWRGQDTFAHWSRIAIGGDKVIITDNSMYGLSQIALNEGDGQQAWKNPFTGVGLSASNVLPEVSSPTIESGNIYFKGLSSYWQQDSTTGIIKNTPLSSAWSGTATEPIYETLNVEKGVFYDFAPISQSVLTQPDYPVTLRARAVSGELWRTSWISAAAKRHIVIGNKGIYIYSWYVDHTDLRIIDKASGTIRQTIGDNVINTNPSVIYGGAVVGPDEGVYVVSNYNRGGVSGSDGTPPNIARLDRFEEGKGKIWSVNGTFCGKPTVSDDHVYILASDRLEARRLNDGGLDWSWPFPKVYNEVGCPAPSDILVTRNLAFLNTRDGIYAVDLTTHQKAWAFVNPMATGDLALSANGVLYSVGSGDPNYRTARIRAFNVK